ncbi:MAG: GGDEF domain-containing protein [bacterium]
MSLEKWKKKDHFKSVIERVEGIKRSGLAELDQELFSRKSQTADQELSLQSEQVYEYLINARWILILVSFLFALINTFLLVVYHLGVMTGFLILYLVIIGWAYTNFKYARRSDFSAGGNRRIIILWDIAAALIIIHYSGGVYSFGAFMLPLLVFEPILTGQPRLERWLISGGLVVLYAGLVLSEHFGLLAPVIPPFLNLSHQHFFTFEIIIIAGMGILVSGITFVGGYFAEDLNRTKDIIQELVDMDSLTGTYNREVFFEELEYEISKCSPSTRVVSILLLSVDNLEEINHHQGYREGDKILFQVAKTINQNVRRKEREDIKSRDIVCRIRSNTFGVILPELSPAYVQTSMRPLQHQEHTQGVNIVAGRLNKRISEALAEQGDITFSIGLANWPAHGSDSPVLIRQAELALDQAKKQHKIVTAEKPTSQSDFS